MELFSERYNCYYQVLRHLLTSQTGMTATQMQELIMGEGFEESMLTILPKLQEGEWQLLKKEGNLYYSKLHSPLLTPLSTLQQSYLKALLLDPRMCLFLPAEQQKELSALLKDVAPLWTPEQIYYFDRYKGGDPYDTPAYQQNFSTLLDAIKKQQYVDIDYTSPKGNHIHHHYLPCKLEYSIKNDKFRLLAIEKPGSSHPCLDTFNVGRMVSVIKLDQFHSTPVDLNSIIVSSYYEEPVTLHIHNQRNALERAMLHFANYEKNTKKIDADTYECRIYYNKNMETELLIELLSFGPMITVLGNERMLELIRQRLQRQQLVQKNRTPLE